MTQKQKRSNGVNMRNDPVVFKNVFAALHFYNLIFINMNIILKKAVVVAIQKYGFLFHILHIL